MKMFSIGGLLAMLVMALGFGLYESQSAESVVTLQAQLSGKIAQGEVMYVEHTPNKLAFFATVEGAQPNADLRITYRRGSTFEKITTLKADGKGKARVTMYSAIPHLKPNDMLELWQTKSSVPIATGLMGIVGTEGD